MNNRFNGYDFASNRNLYAREGKQSNGTPSKDITNDIRKAPVAGDMCPAVFYGGLFINLRPSTSRIIRLGSSSKLSPEDVLLYNPAINSRYKETYYE